MPIFMAELKTKENNKSVEGFLDAIEKEQKRSDSFELVRMMAGITGLQPTMWGDSIIGFGSYHYKYDSGHEGDSCMIGFSPRKQNIALYFIPGFEKRQELMEKLGKHKTGVACLYINKLDDIDKAVLDSLIRESVDYFNNTHKP
jgi:hypothetical protein